MVTSNNLSSDFEYKRYFKIVLSNRWATIESKIKNYTNLYDIIDIDWWHQQIENSVREVPNISFFALDDQNDALYRQLDSYLREIRAKSCSVEYNELRSKLNGAECQGTLFEIILLGLLLENTKRDQIKVYDCTGNTTKNECSIEIDNRWISIEASSMKMYEKDLRKLNEIAVGAEKNGFSTGSFCAHPPLDEAKRLRSKFQDKFPQLIKNIPNVIFFLNMTKLYGNLIVDYCFNEMDWCPSELSRVYFFTRKGLLKKYDNVSSSYRLTGNEIEYLDKIADLLPINMYFK